MSSTPGIGIIIAGAVGSFANGGSGSKTTRKIGSIVANITVEERHQDDLEITDHPVEQGASITDHAFKRPSEVVVKVSWSNSLSKTTTLSGGLANAALNTLSGAAQQTATNQLQKAIGGSALGNLAVAKLSELQGSLGLSALSQINTGKGAGTSAIQDVYQQLLKLQASKELISIYTGKRVYTNMLIKSISTETNIQSENALPVTLICRQVIIVKTSIVSVTAAPAAQAAPQATAPVTDQGTKQTAAADPAQNTNLQIGLQKSWSKS